jgi:hypothetical protein
MTSIAAACLCLAAVPCGTATLEPSPEQLNIITETIDYIFTDSFAQAYEACAHMNDPVPGKPVAHLLFASVLHAEMLDAENYDRGEIFLAHIDTTGLWLPSHVARPEEKLVEIAPRRPQGQGKIREGPEARFDPL